MPKSPHETAAMITDESLAKILEDYSKAQAKGNDPDPQQYLDAHPELAADLGDCLEALAAIQELRVFLQPASNVTDPPKVLGDYELLEEIGRGGMGVVCKARQKSLDRLVALKMIRAADLASETDLQRFRNEAAIVACLDHANIVPIYDVGEENGQLYYSMKLVEGGNLVDWVVGCQKQKASWKKKEWQQFQRIAADLMLKVAKATRHAHQRGILHRDLKPANILLQPGHQEDIQSPNEPSALRTLRSAIPLVTDFGLAKRIETDGELTQSGALVGTPSYMAPEQTGGEKTPPTTATDVYGLGAILYALLTGKPPCQGDSLLETLQKVRESDPPPPSLTTSFIDRDLETICMKSLRKDPRDRYESALNFIKDLERYQEGKPIHARRVSVTERVWRWCRRHPVSVGLGVMIAVLLIAGTVKAVSIARSRALRIEEEVLRGNVYAARGVASTVLWQLERLSAPVVRTAENGKLRNLLQARDQAGLQKFLEIIHRKHTDPKQGWLRPGEEPPYASWFVLDNNGHMLALAPYPKDKTIIGKKLSGRDYFQGAMRRAKESGRASVHISRVYHAINLSLHKFAISAPVRETKEPDSPVIGVVAVTITTSSALGTLQLNDQRHTVALVARRDTNPPDGPPKTERPPEHVILVHPAYKRGDVPMPITSRRLLALSRPQTGVEFRLPDAGRWSQPDEAADTNYRDPLERRDSTFAGRWLAGFAPVGNTELVVVVQQRYEDVVDVDQRLLLDLLMWSGVALILGLMCMGLLLGYGLRNVVRSA